MAGNDFGFGKWLRLPPAVPSSRLKGGPHEVTPALDFGTGTKLALRSYQADTLHKTQEAIAAGQRRLLWVWATGLGKTCGFVALAERLGMRTLIIAHRDELIQQAAAKVRLWWPDADLGIVKAERRDYGAQDVIVASVQSLSPARLALMRNFGLVVVDEVQHIRAPSYGRVISTLRAGEADGPLLLGVTATPTRGDGLGLDAYFDGVVAEYGLLWGIRSGYLVDVRAIEVKMANLHLENVKIRQGDYAEGELGAAMTAANAPWWIVKAWKTHSPGRKTLVFMPTVANAEAVAAEFMAAGIRAASVSGAMNIDERRRVLRAFSEGRIQVLSNCMVATEGYDEPSIETVILGRPTKSIGLLTQMTGRGTRLFPGKSELLVLDVRGASEDLTLCSVASLAGVSRKAMKGRTLTEAVDAKEAEDAAAAAKLDVRALTAVLRPDADLVSREVELFKQVAKQGRVAWGRMRRGFAASAGEQSVILEGDGDSWSVLLVDSEGQRKVLMSGVPLALAQGIAEDHVRANAPAQFSDRRAGWRRKPPSEKMLAAAAKWRIAVDPAWSAGEVSEAIQARIAAARLAKARR